MKKMVSCAARSEFVRGAGRRGAPTGERGANTNREGVASGSATQDFFLVWKFEVIVMKNIGVIVGVVAALAVFGIAVFKFFL